MYCKKMLLKQITNNNEIKKQNTKLDNIVIKFFL